MPNLTACEVRFIKTKKEAAASFLFALRFKQLIQLLLFQPI